MTSSVSFELAGKRVWVAGHGGMVGSAILRRLAGENCEVLCVARAALDLRDQQATETWISRNRPEVVFLAAARVGGIYANDSLPADFIADNLAIALNVIRGAHLFRVKKLLALGSSCIYPREAVQPMREEALLTGPLEPTNEWYAIAKIAAIKLCQAYRKQFGDDFISVMPTNVYGTGDNYHPEYSHVPAALIRRFHEAKLSNAPAVEVWGTGRARREFLNADDLADACVFVMKHYSGSDFLNIGSGEEVTISEFAELVRKVVGYEGEIVFDSSRPDGMERKLLDTSRLNNLGWRPKIGLREGLQAAYANFLRRMEPSEINTLT